MTEPGRADAPAALRLHYIEALARRLAAAPPALRPILAAKLEAAQARQAAAADAAPHRPDRRPGLACAPLADLNRYIRGRTQDAAPQRTEGGLLGEGDAGAEMRSLRRFRETWSRIHAEQQVDQALARGPENAGPLNSHRLVLRALAQMREISPDYLRRFLSHLDALLWLDQASQPQAPTEARPGRRRQRK